MAEILEKGHVYFFYRPKVEEESPEGIGDVQRFFMVLQPDKGSRNTRLIVIGRKYLPEVEKHERSWAFVQLVGSREEIRDELTGEEYQTETRGKRHQPEARPAGEGRYSIARHDDHTHLAYVLEVPEKLGEVQRELDIDSEDSFIISVKNPEKPAPEGAGLSERQKADYPDSLEKRFEDKRFIPADPVELLDYKGAELVLIGAAEDPEVELGIDLSAEAEHRAHVFDELKKGDFVSEPLLEGEWA